MDTKNPDVCQLCGCDYGYCQSHSINANTQEEKDLGITEIRGAKENISDLVVYGDGDTFALLCKASSKSQGWMKSTKVCNVAEGCIVQVTTQQRNSDGSYAVAEALTYVPGMFMNIHAEPRKLEKLILHSYGV